MFDYTPYYWEFIMPKWKSLKLREGLNPLRLKTEDGILLAEITIKHMVFKDPLDVPDLTRHDHHVEIEINNRHFAKEVRLL